MGKVRAMLYVMLVAPALLVSCGCANLRLPAIDPSGRRLFLPNPNYTTMAQDGLLSRLHGANGGLFRGFRRSGQGQNAISPPAFGNPQLGGAIGNGFNSGGSSSSPQVGPYEPALFNRHRQKLQQFFGNGGGLLRGLHNGPRRLLSGLHGQGSSPSPLFGNSAFPSVGNPPLCGPNGLGPDGSPCYPIGSPSDSSLAMTLSGAAGRVGSGLSSGCSTGLCGTSLGSQSRSGLAGFAKLGPGVVLAQQRYTARVGDEVVVLGGLQSSSGIACGGQPVKWSMSNDSVGTIVDAASAQRRRILDRLLHRTSASSGSARCGNCAVSTTSDRCRVITRNPSDPRDDIYLSKGQSWVTLTSGSPGRSFVTLAAPQLNYGKRVATAIIDWTDATWECPRPVLSSMAGPAQLVTRVFRNSDQVPLSNWLVRYTFVDGPKATLNESGSTADVKTDSRGRALLNVFPESTEPGTTRIAIQIFDPDLPSAPVEQCIGYVTWSESEPERPPIEYPEEESTPVQIGPPDFGTPSPSTEAPFVPPVEPPPETRAPPQTASVAIQVKGPEKASFGDLVNYTVEVTNTGNVPAQDVLVWTNEPSRSDQQRGLEFVASDVQPYREQNQLAWDFGTIPLGRAGRFTAQYRVVDAGEVDVVFRARGANVTGVVNDSKTTVLSGSVLEVHVSEPQPFRPRAGETFEHSVRINNRSSSRQSVNLVVRDWTGGIRPIVNAEGADTPNANKGVARTIELQPGLSERSIPFEALAPGNQRFVVTAEIPGANVAPEQDEGFVNVADNSRSPAGGFSDPGSRGPIAGTQAAEARIDVNFNETQNPGASDRVVFTITNVGSQTITNMVVRYAGERELFPTANSTPGYTVESESPPVLAWEVLKMEPGFYQTIEVGIQAAANPTKRSARNQIVMSSDQGELTKTIEVGFNPPGSSMRNSPRLRRAGLRIQNSAKEFSLRPQAAMTPFPKMPSSLIATLETWPRNVRPGEPIEFIVTVGNQSRMGYRDVALNLNLPENVKITDYRGPPSTDTRVSKDGRHVNFGSVREILPFEKVTFRASAVASESGQATAVARVEATGLATPVIVGTDYSVR